jgi:hypothetical protein
MTWLSIAAVVVSVSAVVISGLSYRASDRSAKAADQSAKAADRSATAAESADRRARTPQLAVMLSGPFVDLSDRVIYRVRNDGPQDLDEVVVYRPRPPDNIEYHLAVTGPGAGWADDQISLGPIAITQEALFTLSCGVSPTLPEFLVRIECRSGADQWTLNEQLPTPRPPGLSDEEKTSRRRILTYVLEELTSDIATLTGAKWHTVALRDANFEEAHRLMLDHAPEFTGPIRDARSGLAEFRAWNDGMSSAPENEITQHRDGLVSRLQDAHALLQSMKAALDTPQASGARWRS